MLFEAVDIFWISKLGNKAVAAVGASSFILWTIFAFTFLTCTGAATLISQYWGRGDKKNTYKVIVEATWLSLLFSILISLVLLPITNYLLEAMGLDPETKELAVEYFYVFIVGFPIIYILQLQRFIFNAYGDTKTNTIIMFVVITLNIVIDPLFIFGLGPFPELGIKGASLATIFCESLGIFIRWIYLRKKNYIPPFRDFFKIKIKFIKIFFKIGIPSTLTNIIWCIVFPLLTIIITRYGMDPLAALNVSQRIEGIPYFVSLGFSVAMATLVGKYFGRGDIETLMEVVKSGIKWINIILIPVSLLFILIPEKLIMILNSDSTIVDYGSSYLRIIGIFEIFLGWELVFEGVFNGIGNSLPYMLIRIPLTLLRSPLAYLVAVTFGMGIPGVWWAVSVTTLAKGVLLYLAFKLNYNKMVKSMKKNSS